MRTRRHALAQDLEEAGGMQQADSTHNTPSATPPSSGHTIKKQRLQGTGKAKTYNCPRCGLPKKGHTCLLLPPPLPPPCDKASSEITSASSGSNDKAIKHTERRQKSKTYTCPQCGLPKKNHICEMKPPKEKENKSDAIRRKLKKGGKWNMKDKGLDSFNPTLFQYALRHSSPRVPSISHLTPFKLYSTSTHPLSSSPPLRSWWNAAGAHGLCVPERLSPSLRVQEETGGDVVVPAYGSRSSDSSSTISPSLYLNAAGPVWGLSFSPVGFRRAGNEGVECIERQRFLAVGTSRVGWLSAGEGRAEGTYRHGVGNDFLRGVGGEGRVDEVNLLQVWRVQADVGRVDASLHCLVHIEQEETLQGIDEAENAPRPSSPSGPHWQVSWCTMPAVLSRLQESEHAGLLAVVCGDGSCRVMLIPGAVSAAAAEERECGENTPVVPSKALYRYELRDISHAESAVTAVAWQCPTRDAEQRGTQDMLESEGTVRIACGLSSGAILVWDLPLDHLCGRTAADSPLHCLIPPPPLTLVDMTIRNSSSAARCAVSCLRFCPYNPRLLLSGGHDEMIKVWSDEDRFRPKSSRAVSTWVYDCEWDPSGHGFYWGDAASNVVAYDPLWWERPTRTRMVPVNNLLTHKCLVGGVWGVHSAFLRPESSDEVEETSSEPSCISMVASVSSDGSVRARARNACLQVLLHCHGMTAGTMAAEGKGGLESGLFRIAEVKPLQHEDVVVVRVDTRPLISSVPSRNVHVASCNKGENPWVQPGVSEEPAGLECQKVSTPAVAMHAIDSCNMSSVYASSASHTGGESADDSCSVRLLAYGGAAGLIRLQIIRHGDIN